MTRVLTIADLLWLLLSLCNYLVAAMGRSRHGMLGGVLFLSLLMLALSVFLSYRCVRISQLRNPYLLDHLSQQSLHLYDQLALHPQRPQSHRPALTVHYMWCRNGFLEFKHYLSLLSVAKVLKPDQIVFHYLRLPETDPKGYLAWFQDVQREVAMITLKPILNAQHCGHHFSKGVPKNEDFPHNDGVFMMEDVGVANLSRESFYALTGAHAPFGCKKDEVGGASCEGGGDSGRPPAQLFLVPSTEPYHLTGGEGRAVLECPTIEAFNKAGDGGGSGSGLGSGLGSGPRPACVQLSQRLFPSDVWLQNRTFDRYARWVAYNHSDPISPQPRPDIAAPNVAHVLKTDRGDLSPLCYASVLSAFVQGQMSRVFLHGALEGKEEDGPMWKQLRERFPTLTHVPTPSLQPGADPRRWWLYGAQVLLQYGGVLLTCDTLVQKPLQPLLQYPAVWTVRKSQYRIVHHTMDVGGAMVAAPSSPYLQTLIPVLRQVVEVGVGGGGGKRGEEVGAVAYHLYEQRPSSLHVHLQLLAHLTCQSRRCVPSPGQLDVRQTYTVQLTWTEGSPPATWQQWRQLSTPLRSQASLEGAAVSR